MTGFIKRQLWWEEELERRLQEHRELEEELRLRRVIARLRRSIEREHISVKCQQTSGNRKEAAEGEYDSRGT